ncbi:hypothetical protein ARMGADRAFT_909006, partial [Armillaria gallica]
DDEMEEMVFACNGVIGDADLPPVVRSLSSTQDNAFMMVQSVTVMGLVCQSFKDTIPTLQEIRLTAEREFKNGMLEKWNMGTYHGFPVFMLSNRYFRTVKDRAHQEEVPFSKDVDPVRILQWLARNDLIHTEENEVQYFKSSVDEDGKQWHPQLFRVRDIIEVQCSVIIIKGKGTKHRMKLVLWAIALLDCQIALVS